MTTVIIRKSKQGEYKSFTCMGHAGYKRFLFQKDLVCCAISVLVINTVNSLEELSKDITTESVTTNEETGFIQCIFEKPLSEKGILLMDSLVLGLSHIEEEYGTKYFKLTFEEV